MKRLVLIIIQGLLILSILPACTGGDDSGQSASSQNLIRRGNTKAPETLDPWRAEDVHTFNILFDLFEGLVVDDASGQLVPGVAESWSISDDGLEYVFKLRDTARWSDGARIVAADFVNGFRRSASPGSLSNYAFLLEPIDKFSEVRSGDIDPTRLGVRADSDSKVVIRLSKPSPYFLGVLAMPIAFPLHRNAHDRAQFRDPARFVGNGAYLLKRRQAGQPIRLQRNPLYWDADSVAVDAIEYVPIANENAELNMYRAGELDITATIPPSHVSVVLADLPDEVRIASSLALYYLAFDLTEPPLDNPHLRQALSMAVDRERLVALLGRGEQPAYGIVPPGVANYDGARYSWKDLEPERRFDETLRAYKKAGYGPDNPLRLKFTYDNEGVHEKIALAVSAMWNDVLGVEVELEKKEWKYFLDTRDDRSAWQVMRFSWYGDYNDATTFTDIFRSDSAQNLPRFVNAEYDAALDLATLEIDPDERAAIMRRADEILLGNYPIAPLYFYVSKHMVNPRVLGFENNVLDRHPSKYLSFAPDETSQTR